MLIVYKENSNRIFYRAIFVFVFYYNFLNLPYILNFAKKSENRNMKINEMQSNRYGSNFILLHVDISFLYTIY